MKPLDIDRVRSIMGMAKAFTLDGESAIDRRTLSGDARPPGQRRWLRKFHKARRKREKVSRRLAADKARIERRERNWVAGTWGSGGRSFRSAAQIVAHREAIRQAFEVSPVLRAADLIKIVGERRWPQDIQWVANQGLCTVALEQTECIRQGGKLHGKKRIFTRTGKPWIDWKPYAPKVKAYAAMERAASGYLD